MAFEEFVVVCFSETVCQDPSQHFVVWGRDRIDGASTPLPRSDAHDDLLTLETNAVRRCLPAGASRSVSLYAQLVRPEPWESRPAGKRESRIRAAVNAGREDARVIGVAGEPWEGMGSSPAFAAPPSELEGSARRDSWIHIGSLVAGWAHPRSSSHAATAPIAIRRRRRAVEKGSIYARRTLSITATMPMPSVGPTMIASQFQTPSCTPPTANITFRITPNAKPAAQPNIAALAIYAASAMTAAPATKPAQKTPRVSPPNMILVIHRTTVSLMFSPSSG